MTMICFNAEGTRFNYRVAGIALHDQQVLLNRTESASHWFLPGGRVELGESSQEGLRREMQEELQAEVQVGRLLWVVESFFMGAEAQNYHELCFYYLMDFTAGSPIYQPTEPLFTLEGQTRVTFQWVALSELEAITLYPPFLVQGLQHLPEQIVHVLDSQHP